MAMINPTTLLRADLFVKHSVGSNEQHMSLLQQIRDEQRKNPEGDPNSNDGCWRTSARFNNIEWLIQEALTLFHEARSFYKTVNDGREIIDIVTPPKLNYWTNVNHPGSRNTLHNHVKSHFSCVFYLQGTNTGPLRMVNPANTMGECNFSAPFARDFYFHPKDGDLILWPSWVPHEVETNFSTDDRINVVFDISL